MKNGRLQLFFLFCALPLTAVAGLPSRSTACLTLMTEAAVWDSDTGAAIASLRKLQGKLGYDGWRDSGFKKVVVSNSSVNPLSFRKARGRLETVRKELASGAQWASENGLVTRGIELLGTEQISDFLNMVEGTSKQACDAATSTRGMLLGNAAWNFMPLLSIPAYAHLLVYEPELECLQPHKLALSAAVVAFTVRDLITVPRTFDWGFSSVLSKARTLAEGKSGWLYSGDTVKISQGTLNAPSGVSLEEWDSQNSNDLVPSIISLPIRAVLKHRLATRQILLSVDLLVSGGAEPRLSVLTRTYPKPPAYPVRERAKASLPAWAALTAPAKK